MGSTYDQEIISIIKQNKSKGIRLLFDRYYLSLVGYAEHILHDNHSAEDIVQEFYVRLWEDNYLQKIPAEGLPSYLYTAIRNSCITRKSKKSIFDYRQDFTEIEIPVEIFVEINEERERLVLQEIEHLPERMRQVVKCVMLRGLKYKEAAFEMEVSVNTVKFLLKEAMRRLRSALSKHAQQILFIIFRKYF